LCKIMCRPFISAAGEIMNNNQYIQNQFIKHIRFIESFKKSPRAFCVMYQRKGKQFTVTAMQMEIASDRCSRAKNIERHITSHNRSTTPASKQASAD
jgi:hypothetical protein